MKSRQKQKADQVHQLLSGKGVTQAQDSCMVSEAKSGPFSEYKGYKERAADAVKQQQLADRRALNMIRQERKSHHFYTEGFPAPVDDSYVDSTSHRTSDHRIQSGILNDDADATFSTTLASNSENNHDIDSVMDTTQQLLQNITIPGSYSSRNMTRSNSNNNMSSHTAWEFPTALNQTNQEPQGIQMEHSMRPYLAHCAATAPRQNTLSHAHTMKGMEEDTAASLAEFLQGDSSVASKGPPSTMGKLTQKQYLHKKQLDSTLSMQLKQQQQQQQQANRDMGNGGSRSGIACSSRNRSNVGGGASNSNSNSNSSEDQGAMQASTRKICNAVEVDSNVASLLHSQLFSAIEDRMDKVAHEELELQIAQACVCFDQLCDSMGTHNKVLRRLRDVMFSGIFVENIERPPPPNRPQNSNPKSLSSTDLRLKARLPPAAAYAARGMWFRELLSQDEELSGVDMT